jgi:hypothetical protein
VLRDNREDEVDLAAPWCVRRDSRLNNPATRDEIPIDEVGREGHRTLVKIAIVRLGILFIIKGLDQLEVLIDSAAGVQRAGGRLKLYVDDEDLFACRKSLKGVPAPDRIEKDIVRRREDLLVGWAWAPNLAQRREAGDDERALETGVGGETEVLERREADAVLARFALRPRIPRGIAFHRR